MCASLSDKEFIAAASVLNVGNAFGVPVALLAQIQRKFCFCLKISDSRAA